MGRYVYDANLVTQAIEELNNAVNSLANINTEIQAGISTINSATGANCIEVDYSKLLELQTLAEEVVEEDIRIIQEKVTIIEEYEQAPWHKKLFSSIGMTLTKFGEGVASAFEDIGDGFVSIAGFVGGIFNSNFQNSCAEFIKKDHVGDWFNKQYESGALAGIQQYSWYSKDSIAANIFKGIGCAAPYIALSMTGVGLVTETVAAGIGGIGSGTEAGLQEGKSYNQAFASGLWQGTKNAALVYGMGKLAKGIQANAAAKSGVISGMADDFATLTSGNMDDVAAYAKDLFGSTDDFVAQTVNGRVQIHNAKTLEVVGDVVSDGSKVVLRNLGNVSDDVATIVISKGGDVIGYGAIKNTDDILAASFDDLAKASSVTNSEKVFRNMGKFGNTKVGQALNASDDFLSKAANTKVGQAVTKAGTKIASSKPVQKLTTAVAKTVAKHPVATFGAASTVFTVDQIGEQITGTEYRLAQEELGIATANPQPIIEPTPTINVTTPIIETPPVTPPVTTPPITTPVVTPPGTFPGGGGTPSGGGDNYPPITTPVVTTPTITTPVVTTPAVTTPTITTPIVTTPVVTTPTITTPTVTTPTITTPTITLPNGGGTPSGEGGTPSGGGGYTGGGYTGEIPDTDEGEIILPGGENVSDSFTGLIGGGNNYTKIPTSAAPITTTTTTGTKKSIIPVIAGLSAAAVAGIGTKAYLDKKEESNTEEEFETEEWEDDSLEVDYNDAMEQERDYLDPSDEYAYQEDGEPAGSYEAVNSSELASMQ